MFFQEVHERQGGIGYNKKQNNSLGVFGRREDRMKRNRLRIFSLLFALLLLLPLCLGCGDTGEEKVSTVPTANTEALRKCPDCPHDAGV